jgi:hypothetical protein
MGKRLVRALLSQGSLTMRTMILRQGEHLAGRKTWEIEGVAAVDKTTVRVPSDHPGRRHIMHPIHFSIESPVLIWASGYICVVHEGTAVASIFLWWISMHNTHEGSD